jgi:glucose/mannose-6-phosphate isomerase
MITHISSLNQFDEQLAFVINEYTPHGLNATNFDHLILGGLGGSGIGAVIAKNWFFNQFPRSIECVSDYHLPKYVSEKSLVVLNSYSGNTEETLQMFEEAKAVNATIVILTSGGKIGELAATHSLKKYTIPTGYQPRMTIGFGLSYLVLILGELIEQDLKPELVQINEKMIENRDRMKQSAQTVFNFFNTSSNINSAWPFNFFLIVDI